MKWSVGVMSAAPSHPILHHASTPTLQRGVYGNKRNYTTTSYTTFSALIQTPSTSTSAPSVSLRPGILRVR